MENEKSNIKETLNEIKKSISQSKSDKKNSIIENDYIR